MDITNAKIGQAIVFELDGSAAVGMVHSITNTSLGTKILVDYQDVSLRDQWVADGCPGNGKHTIQYVERPIEDVMAITNERQFSYGAYSQSGANGFIDEIISEAYNQGKHCDDEF